MEASLSDVEERKLVTAASWQDLRDVGAPLLPIERDDIAGGVVGRFVGCERYRREEEAVAWCCVCRVGRRER